MKTLDAITYEVALADKTLKDLVSHFWCSRWNHGVQECFHYHSTANINTELVFAFAPGMRPVFSSLQGHSSTYRCIKTGGFSEMFGVSLRSHAIPYFFKTSTCDLVDQLVDPSEIMQADAEAVTHRLAQVFSFSERVEIMSRYLESKFNPDLKTDHSIFNAIRSIRELRGQVNILTLAKESALSQKQFERRFKNFTGFNPKLYARIFRFECSLPPYNDHGNFTNKAHDLGYYDQAHFINDFKQFSGFSPGNYSPISW